MNEGECTAADLRTGMRFQWAADPAYAHVVCTFMGAAPGFFAAQVRAGLWRFVGTDRGIYPRAARHAAAKVAVMMNLAQIADRNGRGETLQAPERGDWNRVLYVPTWGYDCDEEATGGKAFSEKQSEATRRSKKDAHERAAWMREHGEHVIVVRLRPRPNKSTAPDIPILRTQAEAEAYLSACEGDEKRGGRVAFDPTEEIDLACWIGPHECCSSCGEATPGLRLDAQGRPDEKCVACGTTGFLITTWGDGQTKRWESGERYRDEKSQDRDEGPMIGPVYVLNGSRHGRALRRQLRTALVRILKPTTRLRARAAR